MMRFFIRKETNKKPFFMITFRQLIEPSGFQGCCTCIEMRKYAIIPA